MHPKLSPRRPTKSMAAQTSETSRPNSRIRYLGAEHPFERIVSADLPDKRTSLGGRRAEEPMIGSPIVGYWAANYRSPNTTDMLVSL